VPTEAGRESCSPRSVSSWALVDSLPIRSNDVDFFAADASEPKRLLSASDYYRSWYGRIVSASLQAGKNWGQWVQRTPAEAYEMRLKYVLAIVMIAAVAQAKEPKHYQSGKLLKMESVKCGTDAKNGKSITGEMLGTDSAHMKTRELLCQQYVLETESVMYTIRPKDEKHPVLLPIGEKAQFRIDKDKIVLRVEDLDDKEREYGVVSMVPKDSADATTK